MARATNTGVNMDVGKQSRLRLKDYVDVKYDGVDVRIRRVILHPYYQVSMKEGKRYQS